MEKSNQGNNYMSVPLTVPIPISQNNKEDEELGEIKSYLILTAIKTDKENKEHQLKIKELEKIIAIKEEEEDKNDNRMRYIKGLLQNVILIKDYYIEQNKKWKDLNTIYEEFNNVIMVKSYEYILYSSMINLIIFIISRNGKFNSYFYVLIYYLSLTSIIIYCINKLQNIHKRSNDLNKKFISDKKEINNKIKKISEERIKLENETVTLDNWINEI